VGGWHQIIGEPTTADTICDRIVFHQGALRIISIFSASNFTPEIKKRMYVFAEKLRFTIFFSKTTLI